MLHSGELHSLGFSWGTKGRNRSLAASCSEQNCFCTDSDSWAKQTFTGKKQNKRETLIITNLLTIQRQLGVSDSDTGITADAHQGSLNCSSAWALSLINTPQILNSLCVSDVSNVSMATDEGLNCESKFSVNVCVCVRRRFRSQTIPGHRAMLQSLVWVSGPSQARPPCWGGAHILVLVRWPRPHVNEHRLHGDHSSHTPCTAGTEKASGLIDVPPCHYIKHPITNCSLP